MVRMTAVAFLQDLQARDIRLTATEDRLTYDAPRNTMTEALLALIRQHKADIVTLLEEWAALPHTRPCSRQAPMGGPTGLWRPGRGSPSTPPWGGLQEDPRACQAGQEGTQAASCGVVAGMSQKCPKALAA